MNSRLRDKIAIVTGAGSGIGRARALALAREGARVALVGRCNERIEAAAREAGASAIAIAADVSKQTDIERVIERTVGAFGGLNVLFNNAGILHPGTVEQMRHSTPTCADSGCFHERCYRTCAKPAADRLSTWHRCSA